MKDVLNDTKKKRISRRTVLKGAAALGITLFDYSPGAWSREEKVVNVYNWATYIGKTTIPNFEKETGIRVRYDMFASNNELFGKLKDGNPGYDVVVPSDFMVDILRKLGLLEPLDKDKIPNLRYLDPIYANPLFDPGRKYSFPHAISTVATGYRKSRASKDDVSSWKVYVDNAMFPRKKALFDGARLTLGVGLQYLGYSANTTNPKQINEARDLLIDATKSILTFAPDSGQDLLAAGTCDVVLEWSGDILQVMREDPDLAYILPKEGGFQWGDNWCIPKGAPHPDNAHKWLNFVYEPKVQAEIMNTIRYGTGNFEAKKYINPEDVNNPIIYPPPEVWNKAEPVVDLGDVDKLYDEAYAAIRAG
jgi:spermidine/putrescine transport system substrate-binding protein